MSQGDHKEQGNESDKDVVLFSGVLTRRCGPKKGKVWQERFFTLCQSRTTQAFYLCYYKTSDRPKQQRDISSCYMILASPEDPSLITTLYRFDRGMYQRPGHVFALHPGVGMTSPRARTHRTYLFEAKTLIDRDRWIQALLRHGCQDGGLILPALQDANALHESWLWVKQSGVLHGWKWRLVALRWNEIRYYKFHEGKTQLNGQIMLSERSIIKKETSKKHAFSFQSNSSAKPILFACHDQDEMTRWITAIKRVCDATGTPLDKRDRNSITSCFMDTPMSVQHVDSHQAQEAAYLPVLIPPTNTVVDFAPRNVSTASTTDPPSTIHSSVSSPRSSSISRTQSVADDHSREVSMCQPSAIYSTEMLDAIMMEREQQLMSEQRGDMDSSPNSPISTSPRDMEPGSPLSPERQHMMSEKTARLMTQLSYIPPARQHSPSSALHGRTMTMGQHTARRAEPVIASARPQLTPAVRILPNPFEINQVAATPEHRERVLARMPSYTDRTRHATVSSPPSSTSTSYRNMISSPDSSPRTSPPNSGRQPTITGLPSLASLVNLRHVEDQTSNRSTSSTSPRTPHHERAQTAFVQSSRC